MLMVTVLKDPLNSLRGCFFCYVFEVFTSISICHFQYDHIDIWSIADENLKLLCVLLYLVNGSFVSFTISRFVMHNLALSLVDSRLQHLHLPVLCFILRVLIELMAVLGMV